MTHQMSIKLRVLSAMVEAGHIPKTTGDQIIEAVEELDRMSEALAGAVYTADGVAIVHSNQIVYAIMPQWTCPAGSAVQGASVFLDREPALQAEVGTHPVMGETKYLHFHIGECYSTFEAAIEAIKDNECFEWVRSCLTHDPRHPNIDESTFTEQESEDEV
jgi:hypothetical protein